MPHWRVPLMLIGMFGAALFYGDAVLTPAISVLSAVEGLHIGTTVFDPYVVPIAVGLLLVLFAFQSRGTATVGRLFGPVTMLWFIAVGVAGIHGIAQAPSVLAALNPLHAFSFLTSHGTASFVVLGAVVLAVTGAEALYADMGHFGRGAVRVGWFSLVAPALVLNYFGQGALLMARPEAVSNPFYLLLPGWALYPMIVLATAATVIASQAVISGAFSITRQAVQLGFLPRINVVHTSAREIGQIYMPAVNWTAVRRRGRGGDRLRLFLAPCAARTAWPSPPPCWSIRCSPSSSSATAGTTRLRCASSRPASSSSSTSRSSRRRCSRSPTAAGCRSSSAR